GDGQVSQSGKTPANVFNMFVDAEDLLDDQGHGKGFSRGWHGSVRGDLAIFGRYLNLAGRQSLRIRGDGLRGDRLNGGGEAGGQRGYDKFPPIDGQRVRQQAFDFFVHDVYSSRLWSPWQFNLIPLYLNDTPDYNTGIV